MKTLLLLALAASQLIAPARGTFQYNIEAYTKGRRCAGTRFEYLSIPGRNAVWINEGRMTSNRCEEKLAANEVADFALPYVASTFAEGTRSLVLLRCGQYGTRRDAIELVVTRDAKGGRSVKGTKDYAFEMTVDADGRITRFVEPQGAVGYAVHTRQ